MDYIALDIETIPIVSDPEFDVPEHWTVFAISLGHDDGCSHIDPSVTVFFRSDPTPAAEVRLLNESIDWVADRCDGPSRVVLTYNGDGYDFPILQHRAAVLSGANPQVHVADRLSLLLESSTHIDLIKSMQRREGYFISLDDALTMFRIESDTPVWHDEKIAGADMPDAGLKIINGDASTELIDVVERYAASDVAPLFELASELGEIEFASPNVNR